MLVMSYFVACAWGLVLLASFAGWGRMVGRVLAPSNPGGWGERAAWGIATLVSVGGLLNLLGWAHRSVLLGLVVVGFIACCAGLRADLPRAIAMARALWPVLRRDAILGAGVIALVAGLAGLYLGTASSPGGPGDVTATNFNPHDDFHSYFVLSKKIVQTGSMGDDPFNERRLTSGLGGQEMLRALVVAAVPLQHLHLLDPALMMIVAVAIVIAVTRARGLAPRYAVAIALFVLAIAPPTMNTSAVVTGLVMMLALGARLDALADSGPRNGFRDACLVALLAAGICALKSTLVVPAFVAVGVVYAIQVFGAKSVHAVSRSTLTFGTVFLVLIALLTPWMLAMRHSSGTLLYPILGRGVRGAVLDANALLGARELFFAIGAALAHPAYIGFVFVCVAALATRRKEAGARPVSTLALIAASAAGIVVIGIKLGGHDLNRQAYPFVMAAAIMGLIDVGEPTRRPDHSARPVRRMAFVAIAGALLMAGDPVWHTPARYAALPNAAVAGMRGFDLVAPGDAARYRRMQHAIPAGEPVLTRLEWPFLLDFARNPVFAYDWPGGASPAPGMPVWRGAEPVAGYLREHHVRYLAYSYAHEAGFPRSVFSRRLSPLNHPWDRAQAAYTFEFQDNVIALGALYTRVYDDGDVFVLDLNRANVAADSSRSARR